MTVTVNIDAEFPEKALPLFEPAPYKVMHGGRGGSKSWDFVRAALILGTHRKLFVLCVREFQKSIDDSVHKLISDQIVALNFHEHRDPTSGEVIPAKYKVLDTEIVGTNGTRFVFRGIRTHAQSIKSMEAIDLCLVFEATFITATAWDWLLPTVRRDPPFGPFGQGSEVWVEFNPELGNDYTYRYWVADPPPGTVVVEINWQDNPYFPEILRRQKDAMYARDPDNARTVWGGKVRRVLKGAIYAKELDAAITDGRVRPDIKYDRSRGVIVTFDLGRADMTSIWFIQQIGNLHNVIDHYVNCGFDFSHYLEEMQNRKYIYKTILLPHDAVQKHVSAKKSVKVQAEDAYGEAKVKLIRRPERRAIRINAMRQMFPRFYFNETTCEAGLNALQHYQYGVNDKNQRTQEPLHNWASHDADSIGTYSQWCVEGVAEAKREEAVDPFSAGRSVGDGQGWMGQ